MYAITKLNLIRSPKKLHLVTKISFIPDQDTMKRVPIFMLIFHLYFELSVKTKHQYLPVKNHLKLQIGKEAFGTDLFFRCDKEISVNCSVSYLNTTNFR